MVNSERQGGAYKDDRERVRTWLERGNSLINGGVAHPESY